MSAAGDKLSFTPQVALTFANLVALVAFVCSPFAHVYPMAMVGIVAFTLVQLFLPACWVNMESPICPGNVAQFFFWGQLVVVPILIGYYGPSLGTLPSLPAGKFIDYAIGIKVLGYASFCIAFQFFACLNQVRKDTRKRKMALGSSYAFIAAFAGIGIVGWLLHYGGIGGFFAYISSPEEQRLRDLEVATIGGALGNFLRHFLGFAIVWMWSEWVLRQNREEKGMYVAIVSAAFGCMVVFASFGYNRGSMVAPILGMTAAYSSHVRHISFTFVAAAGSILLFVAFLFGEYRSTSMQFSDLSVDEVSSLGGQQGLVDNIQIYASGPQLTAYMLERLEGNMYGQHRSTIIPSILYPIPIIGKPFREMSGVTIFNQLIYGEADVLDQNFHYDAELYLNFQLAGVFLGYLLLGFIQHFLQIRFRNAKKPITSYAWLIIGTWTMFPGSLPVLSQICIYSFWPIYAYAIIERIRNEPANFETKANEKSRLVLP